jgi:hypothetical protein
MIITILIGMVIIIGDRSSLQISNFSWQNRQIGIDDHYFRLTFNRPVSQETITNNLRIEPSLPGKITWSGRSLTYTLNEIPIYGETYKILIDQNQEKANQQSLTRIFKTRDRVFAYLGIDKEEEGRLILYNLSKQQKNILTPSDLVIVDFAIYPDGDHILFSAFERGKEQGIGEQMLYTVTTGLNFQGQDSIQSQGKIKRILDAKEYQNFAFNLSHNGKIIIIQRVNRNNPTETGLWVIPESGKPKPLGIPAGNFRIAPDGSKVAVIQQNGIAFVPLVAEGGALSFLSGYSDILAFARDSNRQIMIKSNPDFTRTLFVVNQQEETKELLTSTTPILGCEFEPKKEEIIYCLKSDLIIENNRYIEEPYLAAIDLETGKDEPLLSLPNYRDVKMSMSPDGIALLFDQIVATNPHSQDNLLTESGEAIVAARLWLLPLPDPTIEDDSNRLPPESLLPGFNPQWVH